MNFCYTKHDYYVLMLTRIRHPRFLNQLGVRMSSIAIALPTDAQAHEQFRMFMTKHPMPNLGGKEISLSSSIVANNLAQFRKTVFSSITQNTDGCVIVDGNITSRKLLGTLSDEYVQRKLRGITNLFSHQLAYKCQAIEHLHIQQAYTETQLSLCIPSGNFFPYLSVCVNKFLDDGDLFSYDENKHVVCWEGKIIPDRVIRAREKRLKK